MCSATMSTCTCAVSVTVLGVNSNQFWPVHTPPACSYALLSSISKLSLIHQSMQGRVQYGQIGVLTEDHRYCSEVRPVHSWTCTIVCQLCLQRFNHTLAIFIMQHYSAYGQIELSSWSSVMSSIPTRIIDINYHQLPTFQLQCYCLLQGTSPWQEDYSTVVETLAFDDTCINTLNWGKLKWWIPANWENPWKCTSVMVLAELWPPNNLQLLRSSQGTLWGLVVVWWSSGGHSSVVVWWS